MFCQFYLECLRTFWNHPHLHFGFLRLYQILNLGLIQLFFWNSLQKDTIQEQDLCLDYHHSFDLEFHIWHWMLLIFHCLILCILEWSIVRVDGLSSASKERLNFSPLDLFYELNLKFKMINVFFFLTYKWIFVRF